MVRLACRAISSLAFIAVSALAFAGCAPESTDAADAAEAAPGEAAQAFGVVTSTTRVSVASGGGQIFSFDSARARMTPDGRFVVFQTKATFLGNDQNGHTDIFIHDRQTGITEPVSVNDAGEFGSDDSSEAVVTPDGRFVAFTSFATNLISSSLTAFPQVYLRDRVAGTTRLMSNGTIGLPNGPSRSPSISADGAFIVYASDATNLHTNHPDTNNATDVFLRFRTTGGSIRLSLTSSDGEANGDSFEPVISADGRFIAFTSLATNLAGLDQNNASDVFVRDRLNETTRRVSSVQIFPGVTMSANGASSSPAISADGSRVAFVSSATNLVSGTADDGLFDDVFLQAGGSITRLSQDSNGNGGNGDSMHPSIDGEFVAFASDASNLVGTTDTNGRRDVFVKAPLLLGLVRASVGNDGSQGNGSADRPTIRGISTTFPPTYEVSFESRASNLIGTADTNAVQDVFVRSVLPN